MFFFFNDTATTEIYTLSLHDALPIFHVGLVAAELLPEGQPDPVEERVARDLQRLGEVDEPEDRKSTRLNSSHANISYAVFCLKKKKKPTRNFETSSALIPTPQRCLSE